MTDPAPGAGPGAGGPRRRPGKVVLVVCDSLGVGEAPDAGAYGSCERCGRPIDEERLEALPAARLCLDCKRQRVRR